MGLILTIALVAFILIGLLAVYSIAKLVIGRNESITEIVDVYEKTAANLDEKAYNDTAVTKTTEELQDEYSRYMIEISKVNYPENQESIMEISQKANIIKGILEERNEVIPGNII